MDEAVGPASGSGELSDAGPLLVLCLEVGGQLGAGLPNDADALLEFRHEYLCLRVNNPGAVGATVIDPSCPATPTVCPIEQRATVDTRLRTHGGTIRGHAAGQANAGNDLPLRCSTLHWNVVDRPAPASGARLTSGGA